MRTFFITTGYNLSREKVVQLANAGVDKCTIALESADADIHDEIKRREGLHSAAIDAIKTVLADDRIPLEINTVLTRNNVHDLLNLQQLLADMGVVRHRIFYIVDILWGMGDTPYLTKEQAREFIDEIHPQIEAFSKSKGIHLDWCPDVSFNQDGLKISADMLSEGRYTDPDVPCTAPSCEIYLSVEGKVYPCVNPSIWRDVDMRRIGDKKIVDVLKSEKFKTFAAKAGKMPACTNCISKRT